MFLSDPALRAIAAHTNEVWPEHIWRHHTGADDGAGELARQLHKTTLGFNDNHRLLHRQLRRLHQHLRRLTGGLDDFAAIHDTGVDATLLTMVVLIERHQLLEAILIDGYTAWRRVAAPGPADESKRHLLVRPGDPRCGVVTLRRQHRATIDNANRTTDRTVDRPADRAIDRTVDGAAARWQVLPDPVAATKFDVPYADRIIGEVTLTDTGWHPVAHTDPDHPHTAPKLTYPLPGQDDLATACRSLLRWWQLRHSADWRGRTPDQLTDDELAALTT